MLKKGGIVRTIWNIFVAAVFIAFGVVSCAQSGNPDFQNAIILIAGILVIADAAFRLVTQVILAIGAAQQSLIKTDWSGATVGASELAIGILLILVSRGESTVLTALFEYLTKFIGILLIVAGSILILYAIIFLVKHAFKPFQNILMIFGGALVITGGILVLVFSTNEALLQIFFVLFGILFILAGIGLLIGAIALAVLARKAGKQIEEVVNAGEAEPAQDAEVVDEQEEPAEEPEEPQAEDPKNPDETPE
ncbi:MAG: hypothetical protein K6E59_04045 [Bacilli bacterium]|nr:hypothetical protein [Bacilli bacterium]